MIHTLKTLVRNILEERRALPRKRWFVQGFGFLRYRVGPNTRIHIWDSSLRIPGVSDVHDHTQWGLVSHIISGSLVNVRYQIEDPVEELQHPTELYHMATIVCGVGGGMKSQDATSVRLVAGTPELYTPGMMYQQEPDEIHRTFPTDGTVTIIEQTRREANTARVFWQGSGGWRDAIPRQAREDEIEDVCSRALLLFGPEE